MNISENKHIWKLDGDFEFCELCGASLNPYYGASKSCVSGVKRKWALKIYNRIQKHDEEIRQLKFERDVELVQCGEYPHSRVPKEIVEAALKVKAGKNE